MAPAGNLCRGYSVMIEIHSELHWIRQLLYQILSNQEHQMAAIDNLNTNIATLKTDVETLIAQTSSTSEAQIQAAADAVAAVDAEVKAKLTPAT